METLGDRLKHLRQAASMAAIARRVGVTRGTWNNWEKGARTPSLGHLKVIGVVTGASMDWIINGKGEGPA